MHTRKSKKAEPLIFDQEIEKTARKNRAKQKTEASIKLEKPVVNQVKSESEEISSPVNMGDKRTMGDFGRPSLQGIRKSVLRPDITAKAFEIKPHIINMVQNNLSFTGDTDEDPNQHIADFLEIVDMFKIDGASDDAIRLRLFPLSLRGRAKRWLESLPAHSLTTWEKLADEFLGKYFSEAKTVHLMNEILAFKQRLDEPLEEAWDRYQELIRKCPHHNLSKWHLVQSFYNGVDHQTKQTIRAAANGSLSSKTPEEAYDLISNLAQHEDEVPISRDKKVRFEEVHKLDDVAELKKELKEMRKLLEKKGQSSQVLATKVYDRRGDTDDEEEVFFSSSDYLDFPKYNRDANRPPYRQPYNDNRNNDRWNSNNNNNQNTDRWKNNNQGNDRWRNNQNNDRWRPNTGGSSYQQDQNPNSQPKQDEKSPLDKIMASMEQMMRTNEINVKAIQALERQVGQMAEQRNQRQSGVLPGTTQMNPQHQSRASSSNAQVNEVTILRSGKTFNKVHNPTSPEPEVVVEDYVSSEEEDTENISNSRKGKEKIIDDTPLGPNEVLREIPKINVSGSGKDNTAPYPSALKQKEKPTFLKNGPQADDMWETFRQVKINIPLIDAIKQIPAYAKFLKDLCTHKRKHRLPTKSNGTAHVSATFTGALPPKLKDPGAPLISIGIGNIKIKKALLDLGASINVLPGSLYDKFDLGPLKETDITVTLADLSIKQPRGILIDVIVKVEDFFYPADFLIGYLLIPC